MLQDETREHFLRDLISVDDLLSGLDPCVCKDLAVLQRHLQVESDKMVIDQDELRNFILNHPDLCYRLVEVLSRLGQQALQTIKSP